MSWHALTHSLLEPANGTNIWTSVRRPQPAPHIARSGRSLGTATAEAHWRWASPRAVPVAPVESSVSDAQEEQAVATHLVVARHLRSEMAGMAELMGRSEDDIWAEAAREWLMRRLRNDDPPPTTPSAAPIPTARTRRLWSEIDTMLAELRHPRYIAAPTEPTVPAA